MVNSFCVMPFVHAFVTPNAIGPCCAYIKNPKLNSDLQPTNVETNIIQYINS